MENQLTVIIVTYNSKDVISKCLDGIMSQVFDIIVVDNASRDATVEYVSQRFPSVNIIRSARNLGFGRGCNLGLKLAKTKYILLLNPDVITSLDAISSLLDTYKKHGKAAIIAPRTRKEKDYDRSKHLQSQPWVSGAAMLFERSMIEKIGYFDGNIFLFSEEIDLCARARKAGYDILVANNIFMDHLVGRSSAYDIHINFMKYWHMGWSRLYYDKKHLSGAIFFKNTATSLLKYTAKMLLNIFTGNRSKFIKYKGLLAGSVSYLMGRKAFNKNGEPRAIRTQLSSLNSKK